MPISLITIVIINSYIVYGINSIYNYDYETTIRISSLIHSICSFVFSSAYLLNLITFKILKYCIYFNIIFLITDAHIYITNKISNKDRSIMLFHHVLFMGAALLSFTYPEYYCRCILSETSTIFLNLRWFSYHNKFNLNKYINIYSILLWISFIIFRVINITHLCCEFIYNKNYNLLLIGVPFLILNYYWTYLLTLKGLNMYKKLKSN